MVLLGFVLIFIGVFLGCVALGFAAGDNPISDILAVIMVILVIVGFVILLTGIITTAV